MKELLFNGQEYRADKIIKNENAIIGQDSRGNELFAFRGISDFSQFAIENEDGTNVEYDKGEPTVADLQEQIFNLTTQLINGGAL